MTTMFDTAGFARSARELNLGVGVSKAYTPLVVETKTLFTVSGLVLLTSLVGRVTTAITVANTIKLQANPTTGVTGDMSTATDLGTTDTPAGNLIGVAGGANALVTGIGTAPAFASSIGIYVDTGTIEQVTATGADGGITWFLTYVPIESNATVIAA